MNLSSVNLHKDRSRASQKDLQHDPQTILKERPNELHRSRTKRKARGSSIVEFAPALYFLVLVLFFPMLDLIGVLLSYADCEYLHYTLVRQAGLENILVMDTTVTPPQLKPDYTFATDPNGVFMKLITGWYNGIGHYTTKSLADINVSASVDLAEGTTKVKYVTIITRVVCNPLVPIPFPYPLPGFNAPETFVLTGKSIIENVPS